MPNIEMTFDPSGGSTIGTVDLLEDFWFDYLFFRRDAAAASRGRDLLRAQRYLRASLFSFVNYLAGLANRWDVTATAQGRPASEDGRSPNSNL